MSQTRFDEWMRHLTFDYWSTGQHKIDADAFMKKWAAGKAVLLDVRDEREVAFIALPFALHIPIDQLPDRLDEIPRDKLIATFCSGGDRANVAFAYLHAHGFDNVRIIRAGYSNLFQALMPSAIRALKRNEER